MASDAQQTAYRRELVASLDITGEETGGWLQCLSCSSRLDRGGREAQPRTLLLCKRHGC